MHGGGTSTRDGDGELRARGFRLPQHRSTAARGFQLAQHRGSEARGFQLAQHRGSTSASADATEGGRKAPPMPPTEEEMRGFHLSQHRGSTSASADATDGGRRPPPPPPPPQDLSDRPGSSRHVPSGSMDLMVARYVEMGFPAEKVAMALENTGGGQVEDEAILDWLINHETDLEGSSSPFDLEGFSSSSSDMEVFSSPRDLEVFGEELTEREKKLWTLVEMGFTEEEASSAIDICGVHEQDSVLADAILAAQIFKRDNDSAESALLDIPHEPPYFYFENVERAPKGVWDEMSRCLYNLAPEFVDSKDFCAATRKRGYIHNLPVKGRFHIQPMQQRKIQEKFPRTKQWWPSWDTRTQLNCIQTVMAPTTASNRVREILSDCDGTPSEANQKSILNLCKHWNLIWVGPKTVAPLEPDEVESVLGFPTDHTRGCLTRTERYRSLGNSFQVDTVAFHLSVLKKQFPDGIRVLSLFTGIGGAEVALHRLGIRLNVVVSAEISEVNQGILKIWWERSNQKGKLVEMGDVENINDNDLEILVNRFGGFDLVVGGSPCNNISGGNRHSRVGLGGEQSRLFYHYVRILKQVRKIMRKMKRRALP